MVGVYSSGSRILSTAAALAATLVLGALESFAQTYYWNPSMIKTLEAQRSFNWSENNSLTGARNYPPSDKDDQFTGTALDTNWKFVDMDGPEYTATPSLTANPGKLTLTAQGDDVWSSINEFAGVYRTDIKGNFDVSVRIDSHTRTHEWSKAGFMIWNDFTNVSQATNLFSSGGGFVVQVSGSNGFAAHADLVSPQGYVDGPAGGNDPALVKYPCWLRVTRVGTEFRGYFRTDTTAMWTLIGNSSYSPLGAVAGGSSHIGLFTMSHLTGTTTTSVFDDFRGGGNLVSNNLDLRFAGSPVLDNATLAGNLTANSIDFTGYTGAFSFGASTLSVSGNLTFSSGMSINPNAGRLVLSGTSTQNLVPKANDTLPAIWKTGAGSAVVQGTNPLLADSLYVGAGTFDLNSNNAHLQQFTASGGTLQGFTGTDDTLFIYQRAAFGGLQTLTPGSGTVAIKSVGAGRTVSFDPGGKAFRNVNLWAVPAGGNATVQVGPGALVATGDLTFRQQRAPAGQNAEISFQSGSPNVTVSGNVNQVLEGASGANAFPIRMGDGNWSVGGSLSFSLANGSAGVSTLDLTRASTAQTLNVTGGSLGTVRHSGAGTVYLASPLSANNLSLTAGVFSLANNNLTLTGNLEVDGAPGLLDSLGGRTLTVGGNASFKGRAGALLRLSPSIPWYIKVTGSGDLTAEYASLANSDATGGSIGMADSNSANLGGNINWSFGGGAPTQLPRVTTEPRDTTVIEGTNASFSLVASGSLPLAYAWKRNSDTATVANGNGPSLSLTAVTLAMNGSTYRCIVSNGVGKDTSATVRLTVTKAPVPARVAVEPVNQLATVGGSATFSFTAEGDAPFTYAWYKSGDTSTILVTTATLGLNGLTLAHDGSQYYCILKNAFGADTTRLATLNVNPVPVPARITSEPKDTAVFVTEKVGFRVAAGGSNPLFFEWHRKGDTAVLSTDTVFTIASAALSHDGIYVCIVSNADGRDTTRDARLTVKPPPVAPVIIREPSDTLVKVGTRAAFSVGVLGSAPLAFEWRRAGRTAVLSRDSVFVIPAAADSQSGNSYYVVVSNSTGVTDTSSEAHLTVRTCDTISIQVSPDVTINEGQNTSIFGKAICADRFEWSVVSGPAPRLLDPGVDTLAFKAPRVTGDTVIRYLFSAFYGDSVRNKGVAVKVKEAVPDPNMTLPASTPVWTGAKPLNVKPAIFNKAQLDLFTGYPLRYAWILAPALADSSIAGDSLSLRNPTGDGRMEVMLCLDNGGKAACDTLHVDIDRNSTSARARGTLIPGTLSLSGPLLTWYRPGVVRIWSLQGRLLFDSRGVAGSTALIPPAALGALRGRAARLVFTP